MRFIIRLVVVGLSLGAVPAQDKALKDLAGAYGVTAFERNGSAVPAEVKASITAVTIADGKLTIAMGNKEFTATLKLDSSKPKAEVDLFPLNAAYEKGRKFPGIYEYKGGTLMLIYVEDGERPKDFISSQGTTKLVLEKK